MEANRNSARILFERAQGCGSPHEAARLLRKAEKLFPLPELARAAQVPRDELTVPFVARSGSFRSQHRASRRRPMQWL